jgi:hypothetical protein
LSWIPFEKVIETNIVLTSCSFTTSLEISTNCLDDCLKRSWNSYSYFLQIWFDCIDLYVIPSLSLGIGYWFYSTHQRWTINKRNISYGSYFDKHNIRF